MDSATYDELALQENIKQHFRTGFDIDTILLSSMPVSHTMEATVFLNDKKQLYVFIQGGSRTNLATIEKIIARMGIKALRYVPPKNEKNYFSDYAKKQFKKIFPGRSFMQDSDLRYYKTLAPYAPALVQVQEIQKGVINQFDTDSASGWRPALKYAYRRIPTI